MNTKLCFITFKFILYVCLFLVSRIFSEEAKLYYLPSESKICEQHHGNHN